MRMCVRVCVSVNNISFTYNAQPFENTYDRTYIFFSVVCLDEINNCNTKRFNKLIATHELIQHVTVPTQIQGHTLDVIITRDDKLAVNTIDVGPPSVSDHSIIHFNIAHQHPPLIHQSVERRSFATFDLIAFQTDLESTNLYKRALQMGNQNVDATDLFDLYDSTMEHLLDKH